MRASTQAKRLVAYQCRQFRGDPGSVPWILGGPCAVRGIGHHGPGDHRATPYLVDARDIDPVRHDARFTEQIPDRPSIGCLGDGFHATLAPEVDRGADVVRTTATGWSRSGTSIRARPAGVARHDERPRLVGPEAAVQHLRAAQRRFAGSADLEAAVRSSGHRMARLRRRGPRGAGGALGGVGPELRRAAALSGAISVASAVGGRRYGAR